MGANERRVMTFGFDPRRSPELLLFKYVGKAEQTLDGGTDHTI